MANLNPWEQDTPSEQGMDSAAAPWEQDAADVAGVGEFTSPEAQFWRGRKQAERGFPDVGQIPVTPFEHVESVVGAVPRTVTGGLSERATKSFYDLPEEAVTGIYSPKFRSESDLWWLTPGAELGATTAPTTPAIPGATVGVLQRQAGKIAGAYGAMGGAAEALKDPNATAMDVLKSAGATGLISAGIGYGGVGLLSKLTDIAPRLNADDIAKIETANEMGVDMRWADMVKSKPLASVEGVMQNIVFTSGPQQKFETNQLSQLGKWFNSKLDSMAPDESIRDVGDKIKSRIDDLVKNSKAQTAQELEEVRNYLYDIAGVDQDLVTLGMSAKQAAIERNNREVARAGRMFASVAEGIDPSKRVTFQNARRMAGELREIANKNENFAKDPQVQRILSQLEGADAADFKNLNSATEAFKIMAERERLPVVMQHPQVKLALDKVRAAQSKQEVMDAIASFPDADPAGISLKDIKSRLTNALMKDTAESGYDWNTAANMKSAMWGVIKQHNRDLGGQITGTGDKASNVLTKVQGAIIGDMNDFLKTHGTEDNLRAWKSANAAWSSLKKIQRDPKVSKLLRSDDYGESAFRMFFKGKDIYPIQVFREATDPEVFNDFSNKYLRDMIDTSIDKETGLFSPHKFAQKLEDPIEQRKLAVMFPQRKMDEIIELAEMGIDRVPVENKLFMDIVKKNPESIVDYLVNPQNADKIKAIKGNLNQGEFSSLKRAWLKEAGTKFDVNTREVTFSPAEFTKNIAKTSDETLIELYGSQGAKELREASSLIGRFIEVEKMRANPSGSGKIIANVLLGGAGSGALFAQGVEALPVILAVIGTGNTFSRIMVSDTGRKLFLQAAKMNPGDPKIATWIQRMTDAAAKEAQYGKERVSGKKKPAAKGDTAMNRAMQSYQSMIERGSLEEQSDHPRLMAALPPYMRQQAAQQIAQDELDIDPQAYA